jgi:6-phosphogluconolactonase
LEGAIVIGKEVVYLPTTSSIAAAHHTSHRLSLTLKLPLDILTSHPRLSIIKYPIMGKSPNVYSFPGTAELAPTLRQYVLTQQQAAIERHSSFRVAVSGGSLPKTLAQALLSKGDGTPTDTVDFSKWEIFFADERCVPLDHEDSNYKLLKDELLDKIDKETFGEPKVYPIEEKYLDDAQECADQYEKQLVSVFAARDSVKLPSFDLLLLGCGPDGHTCSLFPEHPLLRESDAWVLSISDSPKPPPKRITLSLPVVLHGAKIAFVATGAGKKDIFKKIFETEEGRALPCGLVNEGAGDKVSWFTDNAALEGVNVPRRGNL